jgi:tRNA 2-thiouridine synthesizing protein A
VSTVQEHKIVDSRGTSCPGPITDLFKAYRKAEVGDILELLATDPGAKPDVQAWCRKSGNELIDIIDEKDYIRLLVKITHKSAR